MNPEHPTLPSSSSSFNPTGVDFVVAETRGKSVFIWWDVASCEWEINQQTLWHTLLSPSKQSLLLTGQLEKHPENGGAFETKSFVMFSASVRGITVKTAVRDFVFFPVSLVCCVQCVHPVLSLCTTVFEMCLVFLHMLQTINKIWHIWNPDRMCVCVFRVLRRGSAHPLLAVSSNVPWRCWWGRSACVSRSSFAV